MGRAIVPDIVDGTENIFRRGHFEQWIGHSLVGAMAVGVPAGLLLTVVSRGAARRFSAPTDAGPIRRVLQRISNWTRAIDNADPAAAFGVRLCFDAFSVWIGALSHVLLDLLSHERARLLWPFAADPAWLGAWWGSAWFRVSAPGYPDYPIGPHFVGWLLLSLVGAVMFCRWPPRRRFPP